MNEPAAVAPLPDVRTGPHDYQSQGTLTLAVGAIGIVFGDIGTSPIYAFRETFAGHHPIAVDPLHIHGVLSLIFWSMMIVVTIKYVGVIMRADNKGEGGSLALLALISRETRERRWTPSGAPAGSGTSHPRPRSLGRGLIDNTTRPAKSVSNRRTIRAITVTPRSCHGSATLSRRGQFVPDPIYCGAQKARILADSHPTLRK